MTVESLLPKTRFLQVLCTLELLHPAAVCPGYLIGPLPIFQAL
jgi:hypothetical protein